MLVLSFSKMALFVGGMAPTIIGNFRVKDDTFIADVSINHYFGAPNNVFGNIQKTQVILSGTPAYDGFEITGKSKDLNLPIVVRFKRIAELSA